MGVWSDGSFEMDHMPPSVIGGKQWSLSVSEAELIESAKLRIVSHLFTTMFTYFIVRILITKLITNTLKWTLHTRLSFSKYYHPSSFPYSILGLFGSASILNPKNRCMNCTECIESAFSSEQIMIKELSCSDDVPVQCCVMKVFSLILPGFYLLLISLLYLDCVSRLLFRLFWSIFLLF